MIKIIKRGGFREQAARQLKYKDSVNQRTNLDVTTVNQLGQKLVSIESVSIEVVDQDESGVAKMQHFQTRQDLVVQIKVPHNSKD